MNWETFTSLIGGFPDLKHLHLQGLGEPMMHPHFFDMVRYAADHGIRVTTNTNLTLLNPERTERLIKSGLHTLLFPSTVLRQKHMSASANGRTLTAS